MFKVRFGMKLAQDRNYFVTSDLHFYHNNIMKFCPTTRPYKDNEHMVEALIQHWNSLVEEDDVVFHIGDFCFAGATELREILARLNGTIVFVLGNHDKTIRNQLANTNVFDYLEVNFKGTKVCMFHYAMRVWNQQHRGSVHLYGHSHGSLPGVGRSMDVGFDAHGTILQLNSAVDTLLKIDNTDTEDHH